MDVARELEELQRTMEQLKAGEVGGEACFAVHQRLDGLRTLFREAPEQVEPHLDVLKAISGDFALYKKTHGAELADQFHNLGEAIRTLQNEKHYFRQVLIQVALEQNGSAITGQRARVMVKELASTKLPPANSSERKRLEQALLDSGHWSEVSHLSAAKLSAALARGLFDARQQEELEAMLPREPSYQVLSRPLVGS